MIFRTITTIFYSFCGILCEVGLYKISFDTFSTLQVVDPAPIEELKATDLEEDFVLISKSELESVDPKNDAIKTEVMDTENKMAANEDSSATSNKIEVSDKQNEKEQEMDNQSVEKVTIEVEDNEIEVKL